LAELDAVPIVLRVMKRTLGQCPQWLTCHNSDSWDREGILLVEFLERGATINSEQFVQTLKKLKNEFEESGQTGR
jgi:hypothetical protein